MPGLLPDVDPDGLLEYSVVYTDRALNHMSVSFQTIMRDVSGLLQRAYGADHAVVVPGSGTFGMEAVARQLATGADVLVLRNGWFSFRWSQILEAGSIAGSTTVLKARPVAEEAQPAFAPAPLELVLETIRRDRPGIVFAPHVETSAGMILPDDYIRRVGAAVRDVGGLFVLDCIASGTVWVDMGEHNVDVLISAPQKGWSASPCCGLVMLNERARERVMATQSTSFACDLKRWLEIMQAYTGGGHAYHATMPTDGLGTLRNAMREAEGYGFAKLADNQRFLGQRARAALEARGFKSVAADGFRAPGVIVSYTDDDAVHTGKRFAEIGLQVAAGVPLMCDEPADFKTFRIGLFGFDKLTNVDRTVSTLEGALERLSEL